MQAARGASLNSGDDDTQPVGTEPPPRRLKAFLLVAAIVYVVDQVTKTMAVRMLENEPSVTVIPGVLDLRFLRNPGAAFGVATSFTWLLSLAAIAVAIAVVVMASRLRNRTWALALGLLLAGAVGNLTDRIFRKPGVLRGHVVDFLEFPHWPVFNVADTALTIACVLILVQSFRGIGIDGVRARPAVPPGTR